MRTVLAVAALLVTAGCLGAQIPTDSTAEPTPADGFPPGVSADGVENATELLDAHRAELADSGYAFRVTETSDRVGNGTYTGRTKGDSYRLHIERDRGDRTFTADTWANDSVVVTRVEHGNETRFDQGERYSGADEPWTGGIEHLLDAGEFAVTDRYVVDGETFLALDANQTRSEHSGTFESFDGHAVVDLDGRVHEFNATTVVASESGSWTRTIEFELTDIGIEDVERPAWSDRAQATVEASLSMDSTREHVELVHQGGDPLPEGSTVQIAHDGETHTLTFDQALETGELAYVAYPADGSDPVLSFDEPTGEFERIQGEYEVSVTGPDGAAILNAGFAVESSSAETPDN